VGTQEALLALQGPRAQRIRRLEMQHVRNVSTRGQPNGVLFHLLGRARAEARDVLTLHNARMPRGFELRHIVAPVLDVASPEVEGEVSGSVFDLMRIPTGSDDLQIVIGGLLIIHVLHIGESLVQSRR